jgi:hypothetical protein
MTFRTSGQRQYEIALSFALAVFLTPLVAPGQNLRLLPGTTPLTLDGDLSAQMVAGADKFLMRELEKSPAGRFQLLEARFLVGGGLSEIHRGKSRALSQIDRRGRLTFPPCLSRIHKQHGNSSQAGRNRSHQNLRCSLVDLRRRDRGRPAASAQGRARGRVVALPDAEQTPEQICGLASGLPPESQYARRLAENGCLVMVPTLINRQDTYSGNEALKRFTNLPHREWIYRQSFEVGRHIIGYEVQKILAAVDWFEFERTNKPPAANRPPSPTPPTPPTPIGAAGYGEGALLAFYAAALDERIEATLVSGYFNTREALWEEPIYRNVFRLLTEFGDAEIASLVVPRPLIIEQSESPKIDGPPKARSGRSGAAPGKWQTPEFNTADFEVQRTRELVKPFAASIRFIHGNEG